MGGGQSSRRISIDNDNDPSTVIQISDNVADRLKGNFEQRPARPVHYSTGNTKPEQYEAQRSTKVSNPSISNFESSISNSYPHNTITSIQMQAELEKEISKNDDFWKDKIKERARIEKDLSEKLKYEYDRGIKDMEEILPMEPKKKDSPPCQDLKKKVVSCYQKNSSQTLNCAQAVSAFSNCLASNRAQKEEKSC